MTRFGGPGISTVVRVAASLSLSVVALLTVNR
jgi:hypothetical protein